MMGITDMADTTACQLNKRLHCVHIIAFKRKFQFPPTSLQVCVFLTDNIFYDSRQMHNLLYSCTFFFLVSLPLHKELHWLSLTVTYCVHGYLQHINQSTHPTWISLLHLSNMYAKTLKSSTSLQLSVPTRPQLNVSKQASLFRNQPFKLK